MTAQSIDCQEALVLLQDYLKADLTPALMVALEAHFERCRPCFQNVQFERNFVRMVAVKAGTLGCPDRLRERIRQALRTDPAPTD